MQISSIRIPFYFGNIVNHYSTISQFPSALTCGPLSSIFLYFCFHFNNQIKIQCNPLASKRKRAPKLAVSNEDPTNIFLLSRDISFTSIAIAISISVSRQKTIDIYFGKRVLILYLFSQLTSLNKRVYSNLLLSKYFPRFAYEIIC